MQEILLDEELPENLPFYPGQIIGTGAFSVCSRVRLCRDLHSKDIFAVKFIHKNLAIINAVTKKQIACEVALHKLCTCHHNILQFIASNENSNWRWIALEYAYGGDLFDKIEPDLGVDPEIAHYFFSQLISGVKHLHSKGVAHRGIHYFLFSSKVTYLQDIKPENILLDGDGNLKISDFGLASLFRYNNQTRKLSTTCGSPPYIAPEITGEYDGEAVDTWSCGIVLYTLFFGNTPWSEPTNFDSNFCLFQKHKNQLYLYEPWNQLDSSALSLLQGLLTINPSERMTLKKASNHPWVNRKNYFLGENGLCCNPLVLGNRLMKKLQVKGSQQTLSLETITENNSTENNNTPPLMHNQTKNGFSISAPISSSQPIRFPSQFKSNSLSDIISEDPSLSQFSPSTQFLESLTQRAQRFHDICPPERLTRFYSTTSNSILISILQKALAKYSIIIPDTLFLSTLDISIPIICTDKRKCPLQGQINIHKLGKNDLFIIDFVKNKGDPLEWRRFFKSIASECMGIIYTG
ncbi:uncharacterized protein T551_00792 [Pneumocystis jirovecii RU7]|uniref:non-specific serine/threonine protein kinase n=1 Tax=Pneumocystis jirovecii (strain RU7) TaxID=1408657 RepID=A0A0W4ZUQ1_PNEJ7|nr:uncharacterized protein T551_00792 [Pneumocystis jirovecii RU7]KTW32110.1 hypothetical protein T551_00792 [Pneumocystis jirovecii RU7]